MRWTAPRRWPKHRIWLLVAVVVLQLLTGWLAFRGHARPTYYPEPVYQIAGPPPAVAPTPAPAEPKTEPDAAPLTADEPVDLTSWKLTIPEPSAKGTAANITPADSKPPWLIRAPDGSLTFWAPAAGATTPNSKHPRTELDSLHNFVAGAGSHMLRASASVVQAPDDNHDIILGQIHGAADISSVSFVMLHYRAGTIEVVVKQQRSGSASNKYPLLTDIPLGARFDFALSDPGNGSLVFGAAYGANNHTVTAPIPAAFRGATVRFQAGDYQQGETTTPTAGGRVTFYALLDRLPPT